MAESHQDVSALQAPRNKTGKVKLGFSARNRALIEVTTVWGIRIQMLAWHLARVIP